MAWRHGPRIHREGAAALSAASALHTRGGLIDMGLAPSYKCHSFPAAVTLLETIEAVAYGEAISPQFPSDPAVDAKDVRLVSSIPAASLIKRESSSLPPSGTNQKEPEGGSIQAASAPTMATPRARVAEVDDQS